MKLIFAVIAVAAVLVSCKSEEAMPADFHNAPPLDGDIGKTIGRLTWDYMALDRMDMQSDLRVSTQDNHQNHYVAALADPTSKSKGSQRNPLLVHQVFRLTLATPQPKTNLTPFADGFEQITAMLWSEGALHVLHGPNLTRLIDENGDGIADSRVDISRIDLWPPPAVTITSDPIDVDELLRILADRTRTNEARITALWLLRTCVMPRNEATLLGPRAHSGFDPTKAWITALHNGPDALRIEAARVLRVSPKDSSPAIKGLIHRARNDVNPKVRMEAALTLGSLKAKEAVAELFGSLDDPDDTARMAKILAIRAINEWELAPGFLNAASERTREGTLLALQDVHDEDAIEALDFAVRYSPYPKMRRNAVLLLGRVIVEIGVADNSFTNAQIRSLIEFARPHDGKEPTDFPELPPWGTFRSITTSRVQSITNALREAQVDEDEAVRAAAETAMVQVENAIR